VAAEVFQANGTAERDAALVMLEKLPCMQPVTVGGDKGFDTQGFVAECRNINVTPHVAQNHKRPCGSAIDGRTTRPRMGAAQLAISAPTGFQCFSQDRFCQPCRHK
jgi:hypothetical protein